MKRLSLIGMIALVALTTAEVNAQTWSEWFRQQKTQQRYLLRQIAMLKIYAGYVKKGVTLVQRGLRTVENVKNGEFNLHKDFFSHLANVNPHIANSAKVADIIAYQIFIVRQLNEINRYCRRHGKFTAEEIRYVADVYANMLVLCDANLAELLTIIKPNRTKMSDDERLTRIDGLHEDMLDKQKFVQSFDRDVRLIGYNRQHEQLQLEAMAAYHGLPVE